MQDPHDIEEEISQHLEDRYRDLRSQGLSDAEARRDAARQVADLDRRLDAVERTPPPLIEPHELHSPGARMFIGTVWQDARYALRTFGTNPGFVAVVVLTLALGIGATTAIFSVLDGVMLRPFPYPDVDRILILRERSLQGSGSLISVSWHDFLDWRAQNQVFQSLAVYRPMNVNLTGTGEPERLNATLTSSDLFSALGLPPLVGRAFGPSEDEGDAERVAIISERLWRRRFGGDPAVVGRTIALNGDARTVIGVAPASMRFPSRLTDVWLPLGPFVRTFPPRGAHPGLTVVGRLKPGATLEMVNVEMDTIARRLAAQYPESNKHTRVAIASYYEQVVSNIRPALIVLSGAVITVLLIACANLANLMLSKAEGRHREVAIRASLGAGRGRIVQQLLVESLMLAAAGGAVGALLAEWAVKGFVASQPSSVPRIDLLAVDGRVLAFTALVSIATGVLFGLVPAIRASAPDLLTAMKETSRASSSRSAGRIRATLVVAEIALALVLLVSAGLMVRSFTKLMSVDLGFKPERVVSARITLPERSYPNRVAWTTFHNELIRRLRVIPGIEGAALNSAVPLEGGGSEAPVIIEGDAMPTAERPATTTLFQAASAGYFDAMGVALLSGRDFTERDTADTNRVAIVDESLVRTLVKDGNPIGKRVAFEFSGHGPHAEPIWREIVGVVRHVRHYSLAGEPPYVQIYVPFAQLPAYFEQRRPAMALVARTSMPPDTLAAAVRKELASIDRDVPVYGVQTLEHYIAQDSEPQRLSVVLLIGFGGLALLLAVVGIYGVLSHAVSQRAHEIGVRMALGATRGHVLALVVRQGMLLTIAGLAIGVAGSMASGRVLSAMLFQTSPRDPATFAILIIVLGTVALAASTVPALRATRVNPSDALRAE